MHHMLGVLALIPVAMLLTVSFFSSSRGKKPRMLP